LDIPTYFLGMNDTSLRRPKLRQCVYCRKSLPRAQITDDHIIAGAWYPDSTPSTVQRWTAPACRECNNHFSADERYIHTRLAACIDTTHPAASGMWEKAKASIDPERARGERDREHRRRQRNAFWGGLMTLDEPPQSTLPFSAPNFDQGSRTGLTIEASRINSLVEKWARGIYYKIHGHPVSASGKISVEHLREGAVEVAFGQFWSQRTILDAGPGIQMSYLSIDEVPRRADVYLFKIWGKFEVFASIDDVL
jgi:hypothetical protein